MDGGSLRVRLVCECLAGEACSTNAVSSCPSPDKVDEVTWVPGFAEDELVLSSETDARDINETVSLEGRVELHLSADCRNADAVVGDYSSGRDVIMGAVYLQIVNRKLTVDLLDLFDLHRCEIFMTLES